MTMSRFKTLLFPAILMLAVFPAAADDLSGANSLLCSAAQASLCTDDGACESGPPWNLNIPKFIQIDLAAKSLHTTAASGENRATPIKNLERADGMIFLQGAEAGRAFSFVISEATGLATIAVAKDGGGVIIFGACTPVPSK